MLSWYEETVTIRDLSLPQFLAADAAAGASMAPSPPSDGSPDADASKRAADQAAQEEERQALVAAASTAAQAAADAQARVRAA